MLELHPLKKNKVNLSDYDFQQDIKNRVFFSSITKQELEVLEEILFSPLKFAKTELSRNLEIKIDDLNTILEKIKSTGLIQLEKDFIIVNKELRKYFDSEIQKFDERFIFGLEYIQTILKKVPIQVLPSWYLIPRSSDNIFESLIEKFFITPQIYQRHLMEVRPIDGISAKIFDKLFESEELKIYTNDLLKEFDLSIEELHEIILEFEFNFIGCLRYESTDTNFQEILTPFHEWNELLIFTKTNHPKSISHQKSVEPFKLNEYAFTKDMFNIIENISSINTSNIDLIEPITLNNELINSLLPFVQSYKDEGLSPSKEEYSLYIQRLIEKSIFIGLLERSTNSLKPSKLFNEWSKYDTDRKAHFVYKHPNNRFLNKNCPKDLINEKNIREIEKSLSKLVKTDWIYFEDFINSCTASIGDCGKFELKKSGKLWKYNIPEYSNKEKLFLQIAILEWLFESGIVQTGLHLNKPCFRLTSLGKKMFS